MTIEFAGWKRIASTLLLVSAACVPAWAEEEEHQYFFQERAQTLVEYIHDVLQRYYAPAKLKEARFGWDLEKQTNELRAYVRCHFMVDREQLQYRLNEFFRSMHDYHTDIHFTGTKTSLLGMYFKKIGQYYYVAWIDPGIASASNLMLKCGDRIVSIDGKDPQEAIDDIRSKLPSASNPETDQWKAELALTCRSNNLPRLGMPQAGTEARIVYIPTGSNAEKTTTCKWLDWWNSSKAAENPYNATQKKGLLPELGPTVWKNSESDIFPAYAFTHDGITYGFIRIQTYDLGPEKQLLALNCFEHVIKRFRDLHVRSMVIDQTGNNGGNFVFGLQMLSKILAKTLPAPKVQFTIASNGHALYLESASNTEKLIPLLKAVHSKAAAEAFFKSDPEFLMPENAFKSDRREARDFLRFLEGWRKYIKANPDAHLSPMGSDLFFTKIRANGKSYHPNILMLIDERNLSAADVVPAALAASPQVRLFGVKTAGAGCAAFDVTRENLIPTARQKSEEDADKIKKAFTAFCINDFSCSNDIVYTRRPGHHGWAPVENNGIAPQYPYTVTVRDLQENYVEMKNKILEVLTALKPR